MITTEPISTETIERLRAFDGNGFPVVSLYLGVGPSLSELRSIAPRLKELLQPVRTAAEALDRDAALSVRADIERILALEGRVGGEMGRGVAVFASGGNQLFEVLDLPLPVRDRAIIDATPYVWPLEAILAELRRTCAVVLDRRRAEIYRFYAGQLETWEQINEEELRKSNYGGFSGYEERRVRTHAEEVAHRHFRTVAGRLHELHRDRGYDLLLIGGQAENVEGLAAELHPDVAATLAGRFAVDTHTVTPAIVKEHCHQLVADFEASERADLVARLLDTAASGGLAVVGFDAVLDAVNQRAVENLVVDTSASLPGAECPACGWLARADVADCPACGRQVRRVDDLVDAVVGAVRRTGGSVRHVFGASPLTEHDLGALLRFAVAAPV